MAPQPTAVATRRTGSAADYSLPKTSEGSDAIPTAGNQAFRLSSSFRDRLVEYPDRFLGLSLGDNQRRQPAYDLAEGTTGKE